MKRHRIATLLLSITLASLAAAQAVPQYARVPDSAMSDQIITKVGPVYPPLARQARIQGQVILRAHISKSGDVENLQLISGHPMLAPAAIEAVKQWKYRPFLLNGEPVKVETNVTVNFTLSDKPPAEVVAGSVPGGLPDGEKGGIAPGNPADQSPLVTPQPSLGTPQRVRVSSGVMQGLLVTKVNPQYPDEAKDAHIQGVVLLRAIIDKEGNVANLQLVSGHPMLAPAAIEAVKQWKYRPYLLNGTPIEVETQIQVNFTLTK
jgi:TonB family protein